MHRLPFIVAVFSLTYACAHAIDPEDLTHPERCEPSKTGQKTADSGPVDTGAIVEEDTAPSEDTGTVVEEDTRPVDTGSTGDPCSDCLYGKCGTEVSSCMGEPACTDLMDCLSYCTDDTCATTCFTKFPSPAYESLSICARGKCSLECS
jgi:hypothetical protein